MRRGLSYRRRIDKKHVGHDKSIRRKHSHAGRLNKTNHKKEWSRYSKNIVWGLRDSRSMADLKSQLEENNNGESSKSHSSNATGKRLPKYLN